MEIQKPTIVDFTNSTHDHVTISGGGPLSGYVTVSTLASTSGNLYTLTANTSANCGNVYKVDSPSDNQIGVWTGNGTLEGSSTFTWNGSNLNVSGTANISGQLSLGDGILATSINFALPSISGSATGIIETDIVSESVVFGDLVCLSGSSGQWAKADADVTTTMPGLRLALESKSAGQTCNLLVLGRAWNSAWTWTVGGTLYASTDSGLMQQTAPNGTGDQVQIVGVAYHANKIIFQPSTTVLEIA